MNKNLLIALVVGVIVLLFVVNLGNTPTEENDQVRDSLDAVEALLTDTETDGTKETMLEEVKVKAPVVNSNKEPAKKDIPFEEPVEFGELDTALSGLDGMGEGINFTESNIGESFVAE